MDEGLIANMYPHRSLEELGLDNKYQAFYAGKIALWCYLIPEWDINDITVAPGLTGSERTIGEKLLDATTRIYTQGMTWDHVAEPQITVTPDREQAYPVTLDGEAYLQQVFTATSDTWVVNHIVNIQFQNPGDVPDGTRITDMNGQDITQVKVSNTGDGYSGQFKVLYPAASVEGRSGSVQLTLSADVYRYAVYYALCQETDEYGKLQSYLCDTDPQTSLLRNAISNYSDTDEPDDPDEPTPPPSETALKITKYEAGTTVTLSGATFEVVGPDGDTIGVYTTPESGSITIPLTEVGNYTIYELGVTFRIWRDGELLGDYETDALGEILLTDCRPGTYRVQEVDTGDSGHLVDFTPQEIELKAGDSIKELYFFNDQKPGIWLVKVDSADPSKVIPNARFRIEAVDGSWGPAEFTTDQNGEIDLSELPTGAYVVTELDCPGYLIDEAQRIIQMEANQTARFVFTNSVQPSLHLIKLSSDGSRLAGVTFRIAKIEDGSRYLDRTTDENGEILISGLEPGVYSVKELDTTSDHISDPVERHVELFPGKTSTIILENDIRPNLTVVKRDADTGAPIAGTVFLVEAADGHSVDEIKTGAGGTATLENLLPGVYQISEKSVPSPYLMDAEPQLVTLYPNRNHAVYFENHKKPTLTIQKVDSITGSPIQGAKFQVWYGSNGTDTGELNNLGIYFTDASGQIVLEGLWTAGTG